jgi:RHS repeat-associated protein
MLRNPSSNSGQGVEGRVENERLRVLAARAAFAGIAAVLVLLALVLGSSHSRAATYRPSPRRSAARELPGQRTETSDTWLLPDGAREARIYDSAVNYREGEEWKPIEEGFSSIGDHLEEDGHPFDVTLPDNLSESPIRMDDEGDWISFGMAGAEGAKADLEAEQTVTYRMPEKDTGIEYTTLPNGLKETIELVSPSAPTTFRYRLSTSSGLTPEEGPGGSIVFAGPDHRPRMVIPAPTVSDGVSDEWQTGHASFELSEGPEEGWTLTLKVDGSWLEAEGRKWPVRVDPTVFTEVAPRTCYLFSNPSFNEKPICGAVEVSEYPGGPSGHYYGRSVIHFDLSSIPELASVQEAAVHLYAPAAAVGEPAGIEMRRVTSKWAWSSNSATTWPCRAAGSGPENCGQRWTTPGGDFNSEGSEILTSDRGTAAGWWDFTKGLTPVFQQWVAGGTNDGLIVKLKGEGTCVSPCANRTVKWTGPASSETSKRPYASVVYWPRAPATSRVSSPWEGMRTAGQLKLKAQWKVSGVEGVSFQYREGKSGPFQTIPPALVKDAEGKSVSWPYAVAFGARESRPLFVNAAHLTPTLRKKGGVVQVRALFEGPTEVAGFSAPVETVVDRMKGSPADATESVGPGAVDLLTGNFMTSHSDVSIPTYNSSLGFSRSFTDRRAPANSSGDEAEKKSAEELTSPLGPGWAAGVPLEEPGSIVWKNLKVIEEKGSYEEVFEGESESFEYNFAYALLTTIEGGQIAFEKNSDGTYSVPPEVTGWALTAEEGGLVLTDPAGTRTKFTDPGGTGEYVPTAILQSAGGAATKTEVEYEFPKVGTKRLHMIVAPPAPGTSCTSQVEATSNLGCRALIFNYSAASSWGAPAADGDRLASITYYAPGSSAPQEVAKYEYDAQGRLLAEWDPRLPTPLKESYSYDSSGALQTITPPGQKPWTLEYGTFDEEEGMGRLIAVKRATLLTSPTTAQSSIVYEVPVSGTGAPYSMSAATVAQWGQKNDVPSSATAIFPPDQVPTATPPTSYSHATLYYMDAEGRKVNTAAPSPSGGTAISTVERDEYGNVVRELTPVNRNAVMSEPESKRPEAAEQLDTRRVFNAEGTQLEEEIGPLHEVRLESGATTPARFHRVVQYDHTPVGVPLPFPDPHLPTRETTGAWVSGALKDERVVETEYDWTLRRPTKQITVMGAGKPTLVKTTLYSDTTGLPTEVRQPSNQAGGGAGTTRYVYYGAGAGAGCETQAYYGLPCRTEAAAQPTAPAGLPNQPQLLVKRFATYNSLAQPIETVESPGGEAGNVRRTTVTYDQIGRAVTSKVEGGGVAIPKTETIYSAATGAPTKQQFVCEGCSTKATTTIYNSVGQATEYEDADGNKTKLTYDVDGRPSTVSDLKGTQTFHYAEASGALTSLEVSGVGNFTAAYNADGALTERTLPNGLTAKVTFNSVDQSTKLAYSKVSSCGTSCTWFEESLERTIFGQVSTTNGTLANNRYSYDRAGRLTEAQETPAGGQCVARSYEYDPDSNRLGKTTREPGVGGVCATSGGATQSYHYDGADRLDAAGMAYDAWGRITTLPAEFAGGSSLTTSYFSDDMVASQAQNGVTNTYELDASLRQRQRVQAGGVAGTEVFHYDGPGDSPSWTALGSTWSRYVTGIGGELAAVQESSGTVAFDLENLHGDIVAKASSSPTATKLLNTYRFDEFGVPQAGAAGRFGWLGAKLRRTELASGVIQMGARSYVPQIGRFLSSDPVAGGSANAYDYVNQDPTNQQDLAGTNPSLDEEGAGPCFGQMHVGSPANYGGRNGYGYWYMSWRMRCHAPFYNISIVKIIRTFEWVGREPFFVRESLPAIGGTHLEIGTRLGHPFKFQCLNGTLLKYKIEVLFESHLFLPIVGIRAGAPFGPVFGSGPGEGEHGELTLEAQQYCGAGLSNL